VTWMLAHPFLTFVLLFFAIDAARSVGVKLARALETRARARLEERKLLQLLQEGE
jgi:hypothetical protein